MESTDPVPNKPIIIQYLEIPAKRWESANISVHPDGNWLIFYKKSPRVFYNSPRLKSIDSSITYKSMAYRKYNKNDSSIVQKRQNFKHEGSNVKTTKMMMNNDKRLPDQLSKSADLIKTKQSVGVERMIYKGKSSPRLVVPETNQKSPRRY